MIIWLTHILLECRVDWRGIFHRRYVLQLLIPLPFKWGSLIDKLLAGLSLNQLLLLVQYRLMLSCSRGLVIVRRDVHSVMHRLNLTGTISALGRLSRLQILSCREMHLLRICADVRDSDIELVSTGRWVVTAAGDLVMNIVIVLLLGVAASRIDPWSFPSLTIIALHSVRTAFHLLVS